MRKSAHYAPVLPLVFCFNRSKTKEQRKLRQMAVSKVIFCVGERANQRRTKEGKERPVRAAGNWTRAASSVRGVRKEHHAFKISPSHGGKGYCLRGEIGSGLGLGFRLGGCDSTS